MRLLTALFFGIFLLVLQPGPARAGFDVTKLCMQTPPQPAITVTAVQEKPVFNTKKSRQELAVFKKAANKENHAGEVRGVMNGLLSASYRISHNEYSDKKSGWGCLSFSRIDITLHLDPQIFLASDLHQNACLYREVFTHETQHLQADKALMEKYERRVADGLRMAFAGPRDYATGPVPLTSLGGLQGEMEQSVGLALNVMFRQMMQERAQRQGVIDSGHGRLNHGC